MNPRPRNVVFLDFDGVLLNRNSFRKASSIHAQADINCVAILNKITSAADAVLVVSSTWRFLLSYADICQRLHSWGVEADCIGVTPTRGHRGEEILEWLSEDANRALCKDFVILDDDDDLDPYMHKLVRTTFELGLQPQHVQKALERLA